jgi:hypothetical protein
MTHLDKDCGTIKRVKKLNFSLLIDLLAEKQGGGRKGIFS